jgi:hypothetical protein
MYRGCPVGCFYCGIANKSSVALLGRMNNIHNKLAEAALDAVGSLQVTEFDDDCIDYEEEQAIRRRGGAPAEGNKADGDVQWAGGGDALPQGDDYSYLVDDCFGADFLPPGEYVCRVIASAFSTIIPGNSDVAVTKRETGGFSSICFCIMALLSNADFNRAI